MHTYYFMVQRSKRVTSLLPTRPFRILSYTRFRQNLVKVNLMLTFDVELDVVNLKLTFGIVMESNVNQGLFEVTAVKS